MDNQNTYYVRKNRFLFELCQNRFRRNPNHPWNVCAVASSQEELKRMYDKYLDGGVDWLEEDSQPIESR